MMNKLTLTIATSVLALGAAVSAHAQPGPGGAGNHPPATRAEVQQHAGQMFKQMDVNGDGKLDAADREAHQGQVFSRLDTNGDGQLSEEEFAAGREAMGSGKGEHRGHGKGDHARQGQPMMQGMQRMARMARMADKNGDNAISQDEFTAAALAMFDRADTNGDGTISQEERDAVRDTMRDRMQAGRPARSN